MRNHAAAGLAEDSAAGGRIVAGRDAAARLEKSMYSPVASGSMSALLQVVARARQQSASEATSEEAASLGDLVRRFYRTSSLCLVHGCERVGCGWSS
jgi:hypothetical protein